MRVYDRRLRILHDTLERMARMHSVAPRQDCCEWSRHIYRELNGEADTLAGLHRFTYQKLCNDMSFNRFCLTLMEAAIGKEQLEGEDGSSMELCA